MIQIDKELSTAKKASLQSAKLLINQKKLVNDVISNEGRDIKLRADIESENIIKKYIKENSDLPILAEESGANEDLGSSFWVVDPLDGTSNYSRDFPICCISIALIHENKIILGVINDFNRNIIFEGSTKTPAMMNSKPISVSGISDKTKATLATGLPAKASYKDEAMLALELLENDNKASDNFINFSRDFIDNNNYDFMSPLFESKEDQILLNIMAMKDIKIAKKIIVNNKVNLDKIIYDLKLYLKENQIESLERLVTRGIYEPNLLVKEYLSFNNKKNGLSTTNILDLNNNSAEIRARLFQLAYNAEDESDRAKYLNRLWKKAENIGVYLGVSKASKDMAISINPNEKYIWTLYPMVKALLTNNKLEEAKKWLFLIPDNIKNRSALDINFSKILLLMYIKDKNLLNQDENLPDVSYLLEILLNDIDLDRTKILNATLTMKALNYNLPQGIWKKFEKVTSEGKANIVEKFILRETISSNNRAEAIFKILNMLYEKKISKNYSYDAIFSTITGLYDLGLEDYARDFAFELNLGLAN